MGKRMTAAQVRALELYRSRAAQVAPFIQGTLPKRPTKAAKAKVLRAFKAIYGWGETVKPIMGRHTTVVHIVADAKEQQRRERQAQAFNDALRAKWKEQAERYPDSQTAQDPPTVVHEFRRVDNIRKVKNDVGQKTPDAVRAVFIRQERVTGAGRYEETGDVLALSDGKFITSSGWQLIVFRPIIMKRWLEDPEQEEARVMAQLRADVESVAAQWVTFRGVDIDTTRVRFAPQVGRHRYLDSITFEDQAHALFRSWRERYGVERALRSGSGAMSQWLTGINAVILLGQQGTKQYATEQQAQMKRRVRRRRMAPIIAAFAARRKPKTLRRKKRR